VTNRDKTSQNVHLKKRGIIWLKIRAETAPKRGKS